MYSTREYITSEILLTRYVWLRVPGLIPNTDVAWLWRSSFATAQGLTGALVVHSIGEELLEKASCPVAHICVIKGELN